MYRVLFGSSMQPQRIENVPKRSVWRLCRMVTRMSFYVDWMQKQPCKFI